MHWAVKLAGRRSYREVLGVTAVLGAEAAADIRRTDDAYLILGQAHSPGERSLGPVRVLGRGPLSQELAAVVAGAPHRGA